MASSNVLLQLKASQFAVIVLRVLEATCLSNGTSATVEVEKAWCHYCSSIAQISTPQAAAQQLQPCCKRISSSAINRLGERRKLLYTHDAA